MPGRCASAPTSRTPPAPSSCIRKASTSSSTDVRHRSTGIPGVLAVMARRSKSMASISAIRQSTITVASSKLARFRMGTTGRGASTLNIRPPVCRRFRSCSGASATSTATRRILWRTLRLRRQSRNSDQRGAARLRALSSRIPFRQSPTDADPVDRPELRQRVGQHAAAPAVQRRSRPGSATPTIRTPNPASQFHINEKSYAGYAQANFQFDLGGDASVDGIVGLRVVRTDENIQGFSVTGNPPVATPVDYRKAYRDWLPNANLNVHFARDWQLRLAVTRDAHAADLPAAQSRTDPRSARHRLRSNGRLIAYAPATAATRS